MTVCTPPVDWGCADEAWVEALDPEIKMKAEALAWTTLQALSAGQIAPCPVLVRPCRQGCLSGTWTDAISPTIGVSSISGTPFTPSINARGRWVNTCLCGNVDCSCGPICEVILPGPVGGIIEVRLDGAVIDPTAYRVDNGNRLVRQDGECWPDCQDMSAPNGEEGTFSVLYYQGSAPGVLAEYAAGLLAVEYAKACNGQKCQLPSGVTSITRQGVSMEIQTGMFPNGFTGIRAVDALLLSVNPYGLRQAPRVASPDSRRPRMTTLGG